MEDAHHFESDFMAKGQGYFAIFDGHAGKSAAEWCGNHFHEVLVELITQHTDMPVPEIINKTFLEADNRLDELEACNSGCTAVIAFLKMGKSDSDTVKRTLYTANVGDARAVLCRNGKAVRLSYDHKGSDAQESKRITDLGGFMMNNRVNGVLAVTRSLGDGSMKEFVVGNPYTTETELSKNDSFLILACDGLWDVCDDQDAVDLVMGVADPQAASAKLLDHALSNFSTDNLSIMVVRLSERAD
jgi:protein phosphatase PTC1